VRAIDIGSHGVARNWFGDATTASLQMTQSEMPNDELMTTVRARVVISGFVI
jgi:hypothetical protein